MTAPKIIAVDIREEPAERSPTGRAGIIVVGLFDRGGESHGIALDASPTGRKLAARLAAAIHAGAAFTNPELRVRADGSEWVAYSLQVIGRRLSADLKRLGF